VKLNRGQVTAFLRRPDPAIRAALIFGPDEGLARERARQLARTIAGDPGDPFRTITLSAGDLADDPARLADEAAALPMTGGRRLVWCDAMGDRQTALFKDFLTAPAGDGFIIALGSDLPARSSLRKLFEQQKNAAAIACYADDAGTLEDLIAEVLGKAGLTAEPAALDYLLENLGGDRAVSRGELEKLALYMGAYSKAGEKAAVVPLTLDDVMASIGDSSALALDEAANRALLGDAAGLDRALAKSFAAGQNPVTILRLVARRLQRAHLVAVQTDAGVAPDAALRALRPPAYSREAATLRAVLRGWSAARLAAAMEIVTEAELGCKTTGMPANALCERALLRLAAAARAARR
jgi:DNA polymerase-3 subunit delta